MGEREEKEVSNRVETTNGRGKEDVNCSSKRSSFLYFGAQISECLLRLTSLLVGRVSREKLKRFSPREFSLVTARNIFHFNL